MSILWCLCLCYVHCCGCTWSAAYAIPYILSSSLWMVVKQMCQCYSLSSSVCINDVNKEHWKQVEFAEIKRVKVIGWNYFRVVIWSDSSFELQTSHLNLPSDFHLNLPSGVAVNWDVQQQAAHRSAWHWDWSWGLHHTALSVGGQAPTDCQEVSHACYPYVHLHPWRHWGLTTAVGGDT